MQRSIRAHALATCTASLFLAIAGSHTAAAQQGAIPTPESVLGFAVGADYKLATYDESIRYFERLAAASSSRMKLMDVGKTSTGHPWTLAVITSPENFAKLDRYREIAQRLAHPERQEREQEARDGGKEESFAPAELVGNVTAAGEPDRDA